MMRKKRMKMRTDMTFIRTPLGQAALRTKGKIMRQDHLTPSTQKQMTLSCTLRQS